MGTAGDIHAPRGGIASAEQALRSLPAGVLVAKAPAGEIVYVNEYGRQLARDPLVGRHLRGACTVRRADGSSFNPEDRPLARALSGELVAPHELRIHRCTTGDWLSLRVSAAPIHDRGEDRVVGAVVCFEDLAQRHAEEHALQAMNRRKDEFLAMLAHELATPLNALSAGLGVLVRASDDPHTVIRTRELMERQVQQITRLVGDLRDLAQIRTGSLGLERERIDLREVARAALEATAPLIESRAHRLDVELPARPVWVHGDRARLVQVLTNLLTNAARYTASPGSIRVSMKARGDGVEVEVRDTGVGIAQEDLESIFELFHRGEARAPQGGLGLGLHLARQLVAMHGGSLRAASEGADRGSCFTIRLPRVASATR
jgi:signal transduction histidine kinase